MKLSALVYLYKIYVENIESEKENGQDAFQEKLRKVICESSLNGKHEYNVIIMLSMNIN